MSTCAYCGGTGRDSGPTVIVVTGAGMSGVSSAAEKAFLAKAARTIDDEAFYLEEVRPSLFAEGPSPDNHKRKHRSKGRNRREW